MCRNQDLTTFVLIKQCEKFGINYPMSEQHLNVKVLFSEVKALKKPVDMSGALKLINMPLDGTHHRGVDDARNIATILSWIFRQTAK